MLLTVVLELTSHEDELEDCIKAIVEHVRAGRRGEAGLLFAAQSDSIRRRIVDSVDRDHRLLDITRPFLSSRSHKCTGDEYNAGCHRVNVCKPFQEGVLGIST